MGKPAARMGDTTAHGGSIILGNPLVMIGKMPASAMGDMHVCPMCTGPVPHVGGPITLGSVGVFIGKKPAARIADMTVCVGPPSMPAMGCMTVMIGEIGSGSQAGSAGSAASALAASAKGPKAIEPFPLAEPPKAPPSIHTIECEFLDSANKPVSGIHYLLKDPNNIKNAGASSSEGRAFYDGYAKKGSFTVEIPSLSQVKWSKDKIGTKDKVKYTAKAEGFEDGTEAFVTITEEAGSSRRMLEFISCKVTGGKIEGEWQWKNAYLPAEKPLTSQPAPKYFFQIVAGFAVAVSEPLTIADTLKIKVKDEQGKAVKDWNYKLTLPNGEMVTGVVDATATVTRMNVSPGRHMFELIDPKREEKQKAKEEKKAKEKNAASKSASEHESEAADNDSVGAEGTSDFKGAIFYSPGAQEYLMIESEEDFKAFSTSVEKSHAIRGKTQEAWEKKNAEERKEELEKVRKEWEKLFEHEVGGSADSAIEELLLVQSNKRWGKTTEFVHIPKKWRKNGKLVPGRWKKQSDKVLKKTLDELLKHSEGESEKQETEPGKCLTNPNLKLKLFTSDPVSGGAWKWESPKEEKKEKNDHFEFSEEAAIGRYVRGYKGEAEFAPFSGKVSVAMSGEASFSLFEGKMGGKIFMPRRSGVNLFELLCNEKGKNACSDKNRECRLRITLKNEESFFAGISVSGAIAFPAIDLSKDVKKRKAEASTSVGGFAGVQGKLELVLVPEWSEESEGEFKGLGEIGSEAGFTAGAAANISFKISYQNGRFHYHFKAAAAWGLGGDVGWKFEVDVNEGYKLIHHLLKNTEFHRMVEIELAAFTAYKDYAFALAVEGVEIAQLGAIAAMAKVHHFEYWLEQRKEEIAKLGEKVKGNSLREVMFQKMPPEALGQAILTVMLTREETDFDTIIDILKASESSHETKWVLRNVGRIKMESNVSPHFEKEKERALKAGIKKIEDFGKGVGYLDKDGSAAKANLDFLGQLTGIVNT